jgi:hypothetical protein
MGPSHACPADVTLPDGMACSDGTACNDGEETCRAWRCVTGTPSTVTTEMHARRIRERSLEAPTTNRSPAVAGSTAAWVRTQA